MAIISFANTAGEYLSGNKTETRRDWKYRYYRQWVRWWHKNHLIHDAYDKLPRAGGKPIGKLKLTQIPYPQQLKNMTAKNLIAEGGMCKTVAEFCKLINKSPDDWVTVITFEKI